MFDTFTLEKSILSAPPWANIIMVDVIKNAFTFVLKLLIVSQMQILDVGVVCGGLVVVWGISTYPDRSYHFTKIFRFEVILPFIG